MCFYSLRIVFALSITLFTHLAFAELSGEEIMARVYTAPRVDDQVATLTFQFISPEQTTQKVVYTMVWKNTHGEENYDNKAMYFTEFPPDRKGIAYLGWLRAEGSEAFDDEWIYLPELRMVRRIAHRENHHEHGDDEFGNSLLKRAQLVPRVAKQDENALLNSEALAGVDHYVIQSKPRVNSDKYPYSKVLYWIGHETFRPTQARYFNMEGKAVLDVVYLWVEIDGKWVWKRLTATVPVTGAKTIMDITNIKINTGLSDKLFSSRTLMRGFKPSDK